MTTKHHKSQHSKTHHSSQHSEDDQVSPTEQRRKKRMKSMGIIAVVFMLLALLAYVFSDNERLAPGSEGQSMPAMGE